MDAGLDFNRTVGSATPLIGAEGRAFRRILVAVLFLISGPVQGGIIEFEWRGTVQPISGPAASPPVSIGDAVYLKLLLYDDPALSFPFGTPYEPGPYTDQTFYWYPQSIHVEVGSQVLDIAPPPQFFATNAQYAYTVVRNDAPFGSEFIDSLQVMYEGVNGLYGGIWFQMSTIVQNSVVETLTSGSLSEAIARAALFDYSSLEVQLGMIGSSEGYYTVAVAPP